MTTDLPTSPDNTPADLDQAALSSPLLSQDLPPETEQSIPPRRPDDSEIAEDFKLPSPDTYAAEQAGPPGLDYAAMPDIDEPFDFPSDVKDELNGR